MKLSNILNGIDEMPFKDQMEVLSKAILSLSRQIERINNPKQNTGYFSNELTELSKIISVDENSQWMTIGDILTIIGKTQMSRTKTGIALNRMGIQSKRAKLKNKKNVCTVYYLTIHV